MLRRALCTSLAAIGAATALACVPRHAMPQFIADNWYAQCKPSTSDAAAVEARAPTGLEVLQKHVPLERLRQLKVDWRLDRIARFGLPYPVAGYVSIHPGWIGAYDCTRKNPLWVAHLVTASTSSSAAAAASGASRSKSEFYADATLPPHLRAAPQDYARSGYDRGHLIPAADLKHLSQNALNETFNMANICPQVGSGFNRNYWARLEEMTRHVVRDGGEAIVITGPLYLPERRADGKLFVSYECIGEGGRVAVPTHFFKILLADGCVPRAGGGGADPLYVAAFILPNCEIDASQDLAQYEYPLEAVESAAGLAFFPHLPANRPLMSLCAAGKCTLPPDFADRARRKK